MTLELKVPLAVEKVLFRLALLEGGRVPLARAFVELPLSAEELERQADLAVDGRVIRKLEDYGEYLAYDFLELKVSPGSVPPPPQGCATCGGDPEAPYEAQVEGGPPPRRAVLCDGCFRALRRSSRLRDASALTRLKALWKSEEDPDKIAQVQHEIVSVALRLGGSEVTHTAIAAQSRLSAAQVKESLDRFLERRYVRRGVSANGDALVYSFPPGVGYPERLYARFKDELGVLGDRPGTRKVEVKAKTQDAPPPAPGLKIVVKDVRQRPGRGPATP